MQELLARVLAPSNAGAGDGASNDPTGPGVSGTTLALHCPISRPQTQLLYKLSPSVSLSEYKAWRSAWEEYEELLQLEGQPMRTQPAYFRSCFTPEMCGTPVHAIAIPRKTIHCRWMTFLSASRSISSARGMWHSGASSLSNGDNKRLNHSVNSTLPSRG